MKIKNKFKPGDEVWFAFKRENEKNPFPCGPRKVLEVHINEDEFYYLVGGGAITRNLSEHYLFSSKKLCKQYINYFKAVFKTFHVVTDDMY